MSDNEKDLEKKHENTTNFEYDDSDRDSGYGSEVEDDKDSKNLSNTDSDSTLVEEYSDEEYSDAKTEDDEVNLLVREINAKVEEKEDLIKAEDLEKLHVNELTVIGEAINREYDARKKEIEDDINESIQLELKKLDNTLISVNKFIKKHKKKDNVALGETNKDDLRERRRLALHNIAALRQEAKEMEVPRERKRQQLLEGYNILRESKLRSDKEIADEYKFDNSSILRKAIVNISQTAKLNDSEVDEKLYKQLIDEAKKRNGVQIQEDGVYDAEKPKELKNNITYLNKSLSDEITKLEEHQDLLRNELEGIIPKEPTRLGKLKKGYDDIVAYIDVYKAHQKEINDLLIAYDECEKAGILFKEGDVLKDKIEKEIKDQLDQVTSLVEKTRKDLSKRIFAMSEEIKKLGEMDSLEKAKTKASKKEEDLPMSLVAKELLHITNVLGKILVSGNENLNELKKMTKEERFLAKKLETSENIVEKDDKKRDDTEKLSWGKEILDLSNTAYKLVRNGASSKMTKKVSRYKIDNKSTANAVKNKIDGDDKSKYSDREYESALSVVKHWVRNLSQSEGYRIDMDNLASKDLQVLACMIDEKYTQIMETEEKEKKNNLLNKIRGISSKAGEKSKDSRSIFLDVKNVYVDLKYENSKRNAIRDAFKIVIAENEGKKANDKQNKDQQSTLIEAGIVDSKTYNNYVDRYKREQVAKASDVDDVLKKVKNLSVDGGYYYIVLDNEKKDSLVDIGEPVISSKGITVLKIDENKLDVDHESGEFFIHKSSSYEKLALSRDRIYTVEQDREFEKMSELIKDEELMLSEDNILGTRNRVGIPTFSGGVLKKVKEAEETLYMLEYIHTRDNNTEYEEEEGLIKELSERISRLKEACDYQYDYMRSLDAAMGAYKEFRQAVSLGENTKVDKEIENALNIEYKKVKGDFLKQSSYIKSEFSALMACQNKINRKKFKLNVGQDKEEKNVPDGFGAKIKRFFVNIIETSKNLFLLISDNKRRGEKIGQITTDVLTVGKKQYLEEYMKLAMERDEKNRSKTKISIDESKTNSVSLKESDLARQMIDKGIQNNGVKKDKSGMMKTDRGRNDMTM